MSVSTLAGPRHRALVVDNDDSFTGSLVQQLLVLGLEVRCVRAADVREADWRDVALILLSPGPGRPDERPINARLAREAPAPVFGVCLGMQAIAEAWGGRVVRARRVVHGRTSPVEHGDVGAFAGLPSPFRATRYHSLAVADLPECLEVTARARDGEVMGLRHRTLPVEGVQFHPESVRTRHGLALMANVVRRACALTDSNGPRGS